jgi:hypothetical protein
MSKNEQEKDTGVPDYEKLGLVPPEAPAPPPTQDESPAGEPQAPTSPPESETKE